MSGEVAFGAAISEDRKFCAIVAAGRELERPDGVPRIVAEMVWYEHPRGAVARLDALYMKHDTVGVVLDPKSQSGTLVKPLAEAGIILVPVTAQDVAVAHGEFMDLVADGRLAHKSQKELTDAVRAAQTRPLAGALALDRHVAVDQAPLYAAELAVWTFARWEELAAPGAWAV